MKIPQILTLIPFNSRFNWINVKPRVKKTKEVLYQEITRSISYLYRHGDLSNKIPKRQEL